MNMGQMGIETFKEVVDELEGNVEGITLASRGEPTVNKDLPLMLAYLSGKFLATKIILMFFGRRSAFHPSNRFADTGIFC